MAFEWDSRKNIKNLARHGVSFEKAREAFYNSNRMLFLDIKHSNSAEARYFCLGNVDGSVMTVRFTMRGEVIRIIGAGYWRKGRKKYEKENRLHPRS
jgi:hypothetical protein